MLFAKPLFAQLDNSLISDKITLNTSDSNTWGLTVNNFNYLRNTEYFNDIELGRTLFGYQLNPSLFIQPNDHLKLQAGVFVQSDFGGNPAYNKILPTFSLKITSGKNNSASFIFGTLEGALAHRLIEPLFDVNTAILQRLENGAQFKCEDEKLFMDVWINWEQFINRGSPYKERFTAGISGSYKLYERPNGLYATMVDQLVAHHTGGQIDTDTSNMTMQVNAAVGLQLGQVTKKGWINEWRIDGYVMEYLENTNSGYFPYREGLGVYANVFLRRGALGLLASYWQGDKWIAPRGSTLYSSVSLDKPGYTEPVRQLIFIRFLYNKPLADGLNLSGRIEPVYDIKNSLLDFSYSLYLSYKLDQRFGKLKREF
ncbi:MAG: hypothetical protein V4590_02610 [Bacteroidota bacterium]